MPAPQAPEGADFGSTAQLQRVASAVPKPAGGPQLGPQGPQQAIPLTPNPIQGDLNNGLDSILFGPSERPDEPITTGMPFGPGHSYVPLPQETTRAFLARVASSLTQSPGASQVTAEYAARIARGE